MLKNSVWDDEKRAQLRDTLRRRVVGEVRLNRHTRDEILEFCDECYIFEEAPNEEWKAFGQLAADEFDRASKMLEANQASWPVETDCDRLDLVESALRERGILLWQVSPCCDSCTGGELPERIDEIDRRFPGFRDRARGYAFFIDQNMPHMLFEGTEISVYLAYGWFMPDDWQADEAAYEKEALAIAHEVCDCLRAEGFEPDWDGKHARKIGVTLNWQRRAPIS